MRILVIDDEKSMHVALVPFLRDGGHEVGSAFTGTEGRQKAAAFKPDLVLLDLYLPDVTGLELLEGFRAGASPPAVIIMTAAAAVKTAVEAMKLGAEDYLQKPLSLDEMELVLARFDKTQTLRREVAGLKDRLREEFAREFLILPDPAMQQVYGRIERVAAQDKVTALLLGETGTGKEHAAKLLHALSARSAKPFVELHCGALPETLMESELFGYEAGAFTGATHAKPGKFEQCNKGTILLDEIGEMPPLLQAKLLHVLQDQQFSRLGSRSVIKVDVRILAATNINIPEAIASKRLREDLYYRLNAFTLQVPPLRERKEEIPILLKQFMSRMSERYARPPLPLSQNLMQACLNYSWPGNLRELSNFVKRYLVL
ncbi:MAG TPA: sigma-54 dependent transcriptional regulator, partial [bacterium]|nr:sigma-54 dependent transcriptional regulator [bacterium]